MKLIECAPRCCAKPRFAPSRDRTLRAALAALSLVFVGCPMRPAWEGSPPAMREGPILQPGALSRSALGNGLRIIVLEDHRLPYSVLRLDLRRGEASVEASSAGLASFTAELMKRGAGERDAIEFSEAVDEIGAAFGTGAGWDSMSVQISGLSRDLERQLEILADVALRPRLEEAEAERLRKKTLAALVRSRDDPQTQQVWQTARTLYGEHRFGLPRSGTPETVVTFDAAAARALQRRFFVPNNAVLSASGDVDTEAFLERIRDLFGDWQRAEVLEPGAPPPSPTPSERRIVIVDRPDLVQARIAIAHEGISRTDPDRIAAALLNGVVGGGGFSSRLMTVVRSEAGLTYSIGSGFSMRREPGPFGVSTFTRVAEARRLIDIVLNELARARSEPPSEEELSRNQTNSIGGFSLGLETSAAVMASLVDLDLYGLPEDSLDTFRRRVREVTVEDTAQLAQELLHPERAAIVVVGPAQVLREQLEGLGPIEVVAP